MSSDRAGASGGPPRRTDNTAGAQKVRSRYHHGDLRAGLLRAVGEIIARRGPGELSLREVARRAQVSHGAPAHHFRNKAGLITAFAAQGFERLVASVTRLPAHRNAGSGPEELAGTGKGYIRFALGHPAHFSIMFDSPELDTDDPGFRAASDRAYGLLTRAIGRCVAERRLTPEQAGPATVACWSMAHGFASLWIGGRLGPRSGARRATAAAIQLGDAAVDLFVERLVGSP
jgi:AcrR family transcriptional regulator